MLPLKAEPSGPVYHGYELLMARCSLASSVIGIGSMSSGSADIMSDQSPCRKGVVGKRYSSTDGTLESELDSELSRVEMFDAIGEMDESELVF
jgi:hypothetical protein